MRPDLALILAQPVAHRGLHDRSRGVIENSFAAAEAAIAADYGIECDVQISGDGEAMVFHDETLDRLTAETGRVDARSAAALGAIPLKDGRDTIPTLAAFLAFTDGRVPLVIEIKSRFDGNMRLAARAVALLADYAGAVALKSFDAAVIAHCRSLGAPCPLGLVGPREVEPRDRDAAPPALDAYDFLSWHVADLAALRVVQPRTPAMSWTVRSREDQACATRRNAQIVFEHYQPLSAP
ncbi:glycerophosphodiester phosphodiesterase family protein [Beijerinckia sp. L45]|uniref:glycerophosphodiester phosphodiesterase family protein n=1 Tax=Beijerinckia sp. L45 TaxID=1641855 RepID=UPI00131B4C89|nr:glycerophosphodiester phosphodiesterase family protein [Beijerinckia sp. L45]